MYIHKKILPVLIALTIVTSMAISIPSTAYADTEVPQAGKSVGVSYQVYRQTYGWSKEASNGAVAGDTTHNKRVEAVKIKLTGSIPRGGAIIYQVHQQHYGWTSAAIKSNGAVSGYTGRSKRVEALRVTLKNLPGYKVKYRVYQQAFKWSAWRTTANGTNILKASVAGIPGKSKQVQAIQIQLVKPVVPPVIPIASITLDKSSLHLNVDSKYTLTATVSPSNATDKTLTWTSSSTAVATVDDYGEVTGVGSGIAIITAASADGKKHAVCTVTVTAAPIVTTADVSTAQELNTALANSNITVINLKANITASPTISRSLSINFGSYTITGDVTFQHTSTGTSELTGDAGKRIIGSLTVDTMNASFHNGVQVSGAVNVKNVKIGTWVETAIGNTLVITDSDGTSIVIDGSPDSIKIEQSANGKISLTVEAGAKVNSITSNAKLDITVEKGATVNSITAASGSGGSTVTNNGSVGSITSYAKIDINNGTGATISTITAGAGSDGSTITNNGLLDTLQTSATINLVANVAPNKTITQTGGTVTVTGTQAGSVVITKDNGGGGTGGGTGGGGSPVTVPSNAIVSASVVENGNTLSSAWLASDFTVESIINKNVIQDPSNTIAQLHVAGNSALQIPSDRNDSQKVSNELATLMHAFLGCSEGVQSSSIAYTFNGNSSPLVTYTVSRNDNSTQKVFVATPSSKLGAMTLLSDVFNGLRITPSSATDNGDIFIKKGAYIAVGNTALEFENSDADLPTVSSGLLAAISNKASIVAASSNSGKIKFYLPKDSVLRIGQTQIQANRNITITISGLGVADGPTSKTSFLLNLANIPSSFNNKAVTIDITES